MTSLIHPSSSIGKSVQLGNNVRIGPFCNIDGDILIGDGTGFNAIHLARLHKGGPSHKLNIDNLNTAEYSRLLMTKEFWENLWFEIDSWRPVMMKENE